MKEKDKKDKQLELQEEKSQYKSLDQKKLIEKLQKEMFESAQALEFERAAILRDEIEKITNK